jgi:hypothetical protein
VSFPFTTKLLTYVIAISDWKLSCIPDERRVRNVITNRGAAEQRRLKKGKFVPVLN